ncbi:MAG: hypothetical protein WC708_17330 [Lentisphaeria bacterium]
MYIPRPYRHAILGVVAVALVLGVNVWLFSALNPTGNREAGRFGLVATDLVLFCFLMAYAGFVVQGFRVHWGWGCGLFLIPASALIFLLVHPRFAKIPSIIFAVGVLMFIFVVIGQKIR